MPFVNVHASLGWVNDTRIVSIEIPEDEWPDTPAAQEDLQIELERETVYELVDVWTTVTDEPLDN